MCHSYQKSTKFPKFEKNRIFFRQIINRWNLIKKKISRNFGTNYLILQHVRMPDGDHRVLGPLQGVQGPRRQRLGRVHWLRLLPPRLDQHCTHFCFLGNSESFSFWGKNFQSYIRLIPNGNKLKCDNFQPRKHGGLGEMNIPVLADTNHQISRDYGVLKEDEGIAYRGMLISLIWERSSIEFQMNYKESTKNCNFSFYKEIQACSSSTRTASCARSRSTICLSADPSMRLSDSSRHSSSLTRFVNFLKKKS